MKWDRVKTGLAHSNNAFMELKYHLLIGIKTIFFIQFVIKLCKADFFHQFTLYTLGTNTFVNFIFFPVIILLAPGGSSAA